MPKESLIIGYAEATPSIEIDSGEVYSINAEVANRFFTAGSSPSRITSVPGNATECGVSKLGGKTEVVSSSLVSADVSAVESKGKNLANPVPGANVTIVDGYYKASNIWNANDSVSIVLTNENTYTVSVDVYNPNSARNVEAVIFYSDGTSYSFAGTNVSAGETGRKSFEIGTGHPISRIRIAGNGELYIKNIQVERGSTATSYTHYFTDSISIPSALRTDHPLRSAGSVRDEYDFERMVMVQRVGSVDLGSLTYRYYSSNNLFYVAITDGKYTGGNGSGKAVCAKYVFTTKSYDSLSNLDAQFGSAFIGGSACSLVIKDTAYTDAAAFKTAMSGVMLYYELATPVEVDISSYFPAEDFVVSTEPGGTVQFTQTQSPALSIPNEITFSETY